MCIPNYYGGLCIFISRVCFIALHLASLYLLYLLAYDAVQKVLYAVKNLVDELMETEVVADPLNMLCIFNAPQYLFVYSRLALQFPHSLECVLISSYNTCVPTSVLEMIGVTNGLDSNKPSGDKKKKSFDVIHFLLQAIRNPSLLCPATCGQIGPAHRLDWCHHSVRICECECDLLRCNIHTIDRIDSFYLVLHHSI